MQAASRGLSIDFRKAAIRRSACQNQPPMLREFNTRRRRIRWTFAGKPFRRHAWLGMADIGEVATRMHGRVLNRPPCHGLPQRWTCHRIQRVYAVVMAYDAGSSADTKQTGARAASICPPASDAHPAAVSKSAFILESPAAPATSSLPMPSSLPEPAAVSDHASASNPAGAANSALDPGSATGAGLAIGLSRHVGAIKDWTEWEAQLHASPAAAIPESLPGLWWVAHTKPRMEKALARQLRTRGIAFYLPLRVNATRSESSGRRSYALTPVFPGYVFVNSDEKMRYVAMKTNRIANALPVMDQAGLVAELRDVQRVLLSGSCFAVENAIQTGQRVRVVDGPLHGLEGLVVRRLKGLRLALNVRMLSQAVLVEVAESQLLRIAEE